MDRTLSFDPLVKINRQYLDRIGILSDDYATEYEFEVYVMCSRACYHWIVALISDQRCLMVHNRTCGKTNIEITAFTDPISKYFIFPVVGLNALGSITPAKVTFSVKTLSANANGVSTLGSCIDFVSRFLVGRQLKPTVSRHYFIGFRLCQWLFTERSLAHEDRIRRCQWYMPKTISLDGKSVVGASLKGSFNSSCYP
jgi:hypothetical protein